MLRFCLVGSYGPDGNSDIPCVHKLKLVVAIRVVHLSTGRERGRGTKGLKAMGDDNIEAYLEALVDVSSSGSYIPYCTR